MEFVSFTCAIIARKGIVYTQGDFNRIDGLHAKGTRKSWKWWVSSLCFVYLLVIAERQVAQATFNRPTGASWLVKRQRIACFAANSAQHFHALELGLQRVVIRLI